MTLLLWVSQRGRQGGWSTPLPALSLGSGMGQAGLAMGPTELSASGTQVGRERGPPLLLLQLSALDKEDTKVFTAWSSGADWLHCPPCSRFPAPLCFLTSLLASIPPFFYLLFSLRHRAKEEQRRQPGVSGATFGGTTFAAARSWAGHRDWKRRKRAWSLFSLHSVLLQRYLHHPLLRAKTQECAAGPMIVNLPAGMLLPLSEQVGQYQGLRSSSLTLCTVSSLVVPCWQTACLGAFDGFPG